MREKEQESKIASSKLRELQSSGTGLPVKRESVALKPLNKERQPSVGGVRNSKGGKTQPSSPVAKAGSKSALAEKDPSLSRKPT